MGDCTMISAVLAMVVLGTVGSMVGSSAVPHCFDYQNTGATTTTSSFVDTTDFNAISNFGLDLYRQLASPEGSPRNFFFSPYSIWSAFTLAYFGSKGQTQSQLEGALRFHNKVSTLEQWNTLENIYEQRAGNATQYTLNLANRAFVDHQLTLKPCIQSVLSQKTAQVTFKDASGSAAIINDYVSNATKNRITNIVNPEHLLDAKLVLVNAAFFKGTWLYQFKPAHTRDTQFYPTPDQAVTVPMMNLKSNLRYGESSELGARILELPYSGNDISMMLMLPRDDGPQAFVNMVHRLNARTLQEATKGFNFIFSQVQLQLPKFKMEQTVDQELMQAMRNLGVVDLFDASANLTGFTDQFQGELRVTDIIHKAFVEVTEEGTEAAAVTSIIFSTRSSASRAPPPVLFHCNRPFLFLIQDKPTENILFLGAYVDPRQF